MASMSVGPAVKAKIAKQAKAKSAKAKGATPKIGSCKEVKARGGLCQQLCYVGKDPQSGTRTGYSFKKGSRAACKLAH